jgi:superfamily II DNA helicase RecQ
VKFIFCHPEDILDNKRIVELFKSECVKSRNIFLVADEAHCILDWGDHFRPHYKRLSNLRSLFECQILALSATVTSVGQRDIIKNLLMKNCECVCASPTKENIELIVLKRPSATAKGNSACTPYDYIFERVLHELNDDCKNFPVTIIYCNSIQWLGYGYELAREILEDNFYDGERTPEQAKVVMFHSSMEDSNGKASMGYIHQ